MKPVTLAILLLSIVAIGIFVFFLWTGINKDARAERDQTTRIKDLQVETGQLPSVSVNRTDSVSRPALPQSSLVSVYRQKSEIQGPFKTVARIIYSQHDRYHTFSLKDAIPILQEKARAVGANAIAIEKLSIVPSNKIDAGIEIEAEAILI